MSHYTQGDNSELPHIFSSQTVKNRIAGKASEVMKGKNYEPRILFPVKTSFRNEDKKKTFSD